MARTSQTPTTNANTPTQPLAGKLMRGFTDTHNDLSLDAIEVKVIGRDGKGNIPNTASNLEDVIDVVDNLTASSAFDGNLTGSLVQSGDRITLGDPTATSPEVGYIIFRNAFRDAQNRLMDGRLVYSSAGSENPGSLQVYNSTGEHTVLTDASVDDQFPSFLARASAVSTLQTSLNDLTEDVNEIDISGIETNATAISALDDRVEVLEDDPGFQLSDAASQFLSHTRLQHHSQNNTSYQGDFTGVFQWNWTNVNLRTGSFEAGGDETAMGVTQSGGVITGLPTADTFDASAQTIVAFEFASAPGNNAIINEFHHRGNERGDHNSTASVFLMTDNAGRLCIARPGAGNILANIGTQFRRIEGFGGNVFFTPAAGDIIMVNPLASGVGMQVECWFWDASTSTLWNCNNVEFSTAVRSPLETQRNTGGGFTGPQELQARRVFSVESIESHTSSGLGKVYGFRHQHYETHSDFYNYIVQNTDDPFLGIKHTTVNTWDSPGFDSDLEITGDLEVPTKVTAGTVQIGDTELTEVRLKSLLTELHFPERTNNIQFSTSTSLTAADVDKYLWLSPQAANLTFTLPTNVGDPSDVVFINNLASHTVSVRYGSPATTVRSMATGEVVPFVKVQHGLTAANSQWTPLVNFLTAQAGGLTQTQVDARIAALVQQFARDTTTRLGKGKLPTDTVYDADIADFLNQTQTDARVTTLVPAVARDSSTRWGKSKLPSDTVYTGNLPAPYTLPADLTTLAGFDVAANNNKLITVQGGDFIVSGGYQQRNTNYDCDLATDFGKTTAFVSTSGAISVRMPDIDNTNGGSANVGWFTTIAKDVDDENFVRVNVHDAGDIIGAADDPYVTQSGSGDYIDLLNAGDTVRLTLAGYQSGTNRTWWLVEHNLHRYKVPPNPTSNNARTTQYLRADGTWQVPPDTDTQPDLTTYAQTSQIDDAALKVNSSTRWGKDKLPTDVVYDADLTTGFPSETVSYTPSSNQAMVANDVGKYVALAPSADIRYTFDDSLGSNGDVAWVSNQTGTAGNDVSVYGGVGDNHLLITLKQHETMPFIKINNVWIAQFDLEAPSADTTDVAILNSDLAGNGGKYPRVNDAGDDIEYVDGTPPTGNTTVYPNYEALTPVFGAITGTAAQQALKLRSTGIPLERDRILNIQLNTATSLFGELDPDIEVPTNAILDFATTASNDTAVNVTQGNLTDATNALLVYSAESETTIAGRQVQSRRYVYAGRTTSNELLLLSIIEHDGVTAGTFVASNNTDNLENIRYLKVSVPTIQQSGSAAPTVFRKPDLSVSTNRQDSAIAANSTLPLNAIGKLTTYTSANTFSITLRTDEGNDGDVVGLRNTGSGGKNIIGGATNNTVLVTLNQYEIGWFRKSEGAWNVFQADDDVRGGYEIYQRSSLTSLTASVVLPENFKYATSVTIASYVRNEFRYNSILVSDLLDSAFNQTDIRIGGTHDFEFTQSTRTITAVNADVTSIYKVSLAY